MTCQEFQKLVNSKTIWESTVGERSAVLKHMDECLTCEKWMCENVVDRTLTQEEQELVAMLYDVDMKDPESYVYRTSQ